MSDWSFLIKDKRWSNLDLMELTFHVVIFMSYIEKEVPQPQEEEACGFQILKEDPISSVA